MLVSLKGTLILRPRCNKNICHWVLLLSWNVITLGLSEINILSNVRTVHSAKTLNEKLFFDPRDSFLGPPRKSLEIRTHSIAMFLVTSPIVINVPTRGLLAVETMHAIVQWLENLNIKRNITSMFVNKKHRYYKTWNPYEWERFKASRSLIKLRQEGKAIFSFGIWQRHSMTGGWIIFLVPTRFDFIAF